MKSISQSTMVKLAYYFSDMILKSRDEQDSVFARMSSEQRREHISIGQKLCEFLVANGPSQEDAKAQGMKLVQVLKDDLAKKKTKKEAKQQSSQSRTESRIDSICSELLADVAI